MKKAFTMIELIFVIVIIGILSAVALPKLTGIFSQAKGSKIVAYAGTLQRTTIPPYWSQSIMSGDAGSIKAVAGGTDYPAKILEDLDRPIDFTADPDFTQLLDANATFTDGTAPAKVMATAIINSLTYKLACTNGTKFKAPVCDIYDGSKWILKNNR